MLQNWEVLFRRYIEKKCTPEEEQMVEDWLATTGTYTDQKKAIWQILEQHHQSGTDPELKQKLSKNFEAIMQSIEADEREQSHSTNRFWYRASAAAAIIIIVISSIVFVLLQNKTIPAGEIAQKDIHQSKKDIAPGGDKAILTLGDGKKIVLEETGNGNVASEGSVNISKSGNRVAYGGEDNESASIYNTLSTPVGGQYHLVLSDGSDVWLNSASSIRFPVAFKGNERKVEVTGEVYFEVASAYSGTGKKKSFIVDVKKGDEPIRSIEVLGTHFNINAYDDEPSLNTTLLEGSIKLKDNGTAHTLNPGQQASSGQSGTTISNDADLKQAVAWKDGYFYFKDNSIEQVMKQMSRWYNVRVEYKGKEIQELFIAEIPRNVSISKFLKILELTGWVKFEINEKTIVVTANN
ncbi:MAG: DUF4974 domain-containing protein [Agriterribacter sp.]